MKKILVIEDDHNIRESIVELLEIKEYKVTSAENGSMGLEKAREHQPDMIICDIMMPGLTGHEVLEKCKEDKSLAGTPFIFLSALSTKGDVREGMNLGADDYLTKPFYAAELYEAIEARFKKKELDAETAGKSVEPLKEKNVQRGMIDPIQALKSSTKLILNYFDEYSRDETISYLNRSYSILNKVERSSKNLILYQSLELSKYDENMRRKLATGVSEVSIDWLRPHVAEVAELMGRSSDVFIKDFPAIKFSIPAEIFKVIINEILINAFQYSEPDQLVEVAIHRSEYAVLEIKNRGKQINDKVLNLLGKEPWQNSQGMGMGIYLSKSLAEIAGGDLTISSEPESVSVKLSIPLS